MTIDEANAAYAQNAGYQTADEARQFIRACRILMNQAQQAGSDGQYVGRNITVFRDLIRDAENFLAQSDVADGGAVGVIHPSVRGFRC